MKNGGKVIILGTEYSIDLVKPEGQSENGHCEAYTKELVVVDYEQDNECYKDIEAYKRKVLRHEIAHAFFYECGASSYYKDEALVEWLAINGLKLAKAFKDAGAEY